MNENKLFSDSLGINIFTSFLTACFISLVTAFLTLPFVDLTDSIWQFFDKNALQFVSNSHDPFRVGLEASFLASFLTCLLLVGIYHYGKKRNL